MASYILTNKAVRDLTEIWTNPLNTWSERQADKYDFLILEACQELADGKVTGKRYAEINAELFGYRIVQHVLFYKKLSADKIIIVRILHTQMDLKNRINE